MPPVGSLRSSDFRVQGFSRLSSLQTSRGFPWFFHVFPDVFNGWRELASVSRCRVSWIFVCWMVQCTTGRLRNSMPFPFVKMMCLSRFYWFRFMFYCDCCFLVSCWFNLIAWGILFLSNAKHVVSWKFSKATSTRPLPPDKVEVSVDHMFDMFLTLIDWFQLCLIFVAGRNWKQNSICSNCSQSQGALEDWSQHWTDLLRHVDSKACWEMATALGPVMDINELWYSYGTDMLMIFGLELLFDG